MKHLDWLRHLRLVLVALLCLCWADSAYAGGSLKVDEPYGSGCSDFSTLNTTTSTVEIIAKLSGTGVTAVTQVTSFSIVVNGVARAATTSISAGTVTGKVVVPLTQNPTRLVSYATATVSYGGTNPNLVPPSFSEASFDIGTPSYKFIAAITESFDSRNASNDPDGTTGQGTIIETIYSKIRLRGMRFDGRACDAYDHVEQLIYPLTKTGQRYHWLRDNPVSTAVLGGYPAVYLKGSIPKLNIQTEPLNGSPVQVKAVIDATTVFTAKGSAPKPPGYPLTITQTLASGSATLTLPALPAYVNAYALTASITFQCQKSDNTWINVDGLLKDDATFRIYAIHAAPNAPMTTPWIGVLEDSCRFGQNQSTTEGVAKEETRGVYYDKQLGYPLSTNTIWWDFSQATGGNKLRFRLTDFLNTGGNKSANCVDVSNYLCICANSQGLSFKVSQYGNVNGQNVRTYFRTNPVCLIGGNPALNNSAGSIQWSVSNWEFHQICQSQANAVYDACAAQKFTPTGQIYRDPPVNWTLASYWQRFSPYADGGPPEFAGWSYMGLADYATTQSGARYPNNSSCAPLLVAPFAAGTASSYVPLVR